MLRAILLDFDGVIADTEPIHFAGFKKILSEEGLKLTKRQYYARYLGYDDVDCFHQVYKDRGRRLSRRVLSQLVKRKTRYVKSVLRKKQVLLPGVKRAVRMLRRRYTLAIVSGALRQEIRLILRQAGLLSAYSVLVAAEDVKAGKPHPEGYTKALQLLNQNVFSPEWPLRANECLVVEDSLWGIQAAHRAGMPCVAVSSSYPRSRLKSAELVLGGLQDIQVKSLPRLESLLR